MVVVVCALLGGCFWSGKKRGTNLPPADDGQIVDINKTPDRGRL